MEFELVSHVNSTVLTHEVAERLFSAAQQVLTIPAKYEFSVSLVDNAAIAQLNEQYRGKIGPTDVLTFPYDDSSDIIISVDKIREQAAEYGHSESDEAAFLLVHGILHSMGWDHERSEEEDREQRALEQHILQKCGYTYAR